MSLPLIPGGEQGDHKEKFRKVTAIIHELSCGAYFIGAVRSAMGPEINIHQLSESGMCSNTQKEHNQTGTHTRTTRRSIGTGNCPGKKAASSQEVQVHKVV